jgi:hypothetical protein
MVLAQLGPFAEKLPIAFLFWFSLFLSCPPAPAPAHEPTLPAHFASLAESGKNASDIPPSRPADPSPTCRLSVKLTEAETGKATAGLVRIRTAEGSALKFDELVNRGTMLSPDHGARQWHVVLGSAVLSVPGAEVTIEAISGLETELAQQSVDLRDRESAEVALPLKRFGRIADKGWRGGNTHLHLHSLTRDEADRYLRSIARADELELVFVSYLSRAKADERYISNQYARGDLRALSGHGVAFAWGEEHRHNFGVGGEGYGHVMLLDVKELIHPVSIGPGIMGAGTDAPPLRRVLEQARRDGGTTIWCHNAWGFERVSDWVAGLLDAHNIFDGGSYGNFEDGFYRLMNIGLRVPFSTGTDWFLFDFSRVYVQLDGALTTERWLEALKRGRSFITNGPLLELDVDGHGPGDLVSLAQPRALPVSARAVGRADFQKMELVYNGRQVAAGRSRAVGGHYEASLKTAIRIDQPGWLAVRVTSDAKNELGAPLFGHTSAVYFELAGKRIFDPAVAGKLIADMEEAIRRIEKQGKFADAAERDAVLGVYREGIATLGRRLDR